jgi:ribosomal protein L32E
MDVRQDAYRKQRLAHTDAWRQSNAEDFCVRKEVDPDTGKSLPGARLPYEET